MSPSPIRAAPSTALADVVPYTNDCSLSRFGARTVVSTPQEIRSFLSELSGLAPEALDGRWSLRELGLSSFAVMRLVTDLESELAVELPDEVLPRFISAPARDLAALVAAALEDNR